MSALRQMLKSAFNAAIPPGWLLIQGPPSEASLGTAEIAITIDDGPHPGHTPRVLDVLAESGMKATFFVVGEMCRRYPDVIRRIASEGHELGNHTWSHSEPTKTSTATFLKETVQTRQLLQDLTGRDCHLTRPPKGKLTVGKAIGLWRQQQTIVLWSVDPKDFAMQDRHEMLHWCDHYRPRAGHIVLLHDDQPYAAICLERLSAAADDRTRFVTISHWLSKQSVITARDPQRLTANAAEPLASGMASASQSGLEFTGGLTHPVRL